MCSNIIRTFLEKLINSNSHLKYFLKCIKYSLNSENMQDILLLNNNPRIVKFNHLGDLNQYIHYY